MTAAAWLQAGATALLLVVTYFYARATYRVVAANNKLVEVTKTIASVSAQALWSEVVPVLAIETWPGTFHSDRAELHPSFLNVGKGPALKVDFEVHFPDSPGPLAPLMFPKSYFIPAGQSRGVSLYLDAEHRRALPHDMRSVVLVARYMDAVGGEYEVRHQLDVASVILRNGQELGDFSDA